jgi:hypothetical protein
MIFAACNAQHAQALNRLRASAIDRRKHSDAFGEKATAQALNLAMTDSLAVERHQAWRACPQ